MQMRPMRLAVMRRLACIGLVLMCCKVKLGASQDASDTYGSTSCTEMTVAGLDPESFPDDSTVYTIERGDGDTRATYVSEDDTLLIWYSATEPVAWTSETVEAGLNDCTGYWVISSNPREDSFADLDWYQTLSPPTCEVDPSELATNAWVRMTRDSVDADGTLSDADVQVVCQVEESDDGDGPAVSRRTVIILIIIGGAVFMALMCLGALACCIRGKNSPENAVMPPGELTDASIIGSKAGPIKPGLHAHPEVEGSQHPRPEDRAPSHVSIPRIPQGSRSGPSVRSIGYT